MAAIKNIAAEEEEDDVSLSDLPVELIKQEEETQLSTAKSDSAAQDQEFDFGASIRGDSDLMGGTKMCAADEVFFQGQLLPLRFSVSSDVGFTGLIRRYPSSNSGFRSTSCCSRISHNSSFSSTSSSTTATTTTHIASSKPRSSPRKPRNQFYAEPSPKPQIKIPNPRLEKAGSNRHQKSSVWDFFRLGLVRTPEMELQDLNKVIRCNSNNRSSVSRNSSVSSNNSANLFANFSSIANFSGGLRAENAKQSKKQRFFGNVHGCKCSFESVVVSDNVIVKSRSSSSGRISDGSESGGAATNAAELKIIKQKQSKKQTTKQKQKEAMSHHRTYEWLKELTHANSPLPVHV